MQGSFFTAGDEDFEYAVQNIDTKGVRQHVPTAEETKAELIDKICSLITSKDNGRDGKFDEFNLTSERLRMKHWDIPALTARLDEVVRKQTLSKAPMGELQQLVQAARPYVGYPTLPKQIVPRGEIRAIPLDSAYIRGLDSWDIKRLVRLYGPQVNDRLAGK
jgi:hypothetical protein